MTEPRILTIDIETAPHVAMTWGLFNQNVGLNQLVTPTRVICFAAKWLGHPTVIFRSEFHNGQEEMLAKAWQLLDEADVVVGYNSRTFDIPHLNREFLLAGMPPPSPYKQVDLLQTARRMFRFASNKLQHVSTQLGFEGKVQHAGHELWTKCLAGDAAAWSKMRNYNKGDVVLEEGVYLRLLPWINNHPAVGLYTGNPDSCRNCGGSDLEKRGFAYTDTAKFQQFRCNDCGRWGRSAKAIERVNMRTVA